MVYGVIGSLLGWARWIVTSILMPPDFLELARRSLGFLEQEHGFELGAYEVASIFDNASAEFRSPVLRVKAIRERSVMWLELGPALGVPAFWFDLPLVLALLGDRAAVQRLEAAGRSIEAQAAALREHYGRIVPLFSPAEYTGTVRRLNGLAEERATKLFGP